MSYEERWPIKNTIPDLRHKIAECMWWLIVLAKRAELDPEELFLEFLEKTDKKVR
jgi:NTP pyrophosphatase (non-canonical NTP hydrolase)